MEPRVEKYWLIRHKLAMMDGIAMKCKCIIIPCPLQKQILEWLHSSHMGIEKAYLLVIESVYWVNMSTDIVQIVRQCSVCLEYQCALLHEAALHYNIQHKPREVVGSDVFMINSKNLMPFSCF